MSGHSSPDYRVSRDECSSRQILRSQEFGKAQIHVFHFIYFFLERVHGSQLYSKVYDGNSIRRPGGPQFPAKQTKQHTPVKLGARVVTNQRRGRTCSPPPQPVHSVRPCAVKQLGHSGNHGTEPTPTSRANGAPRNLPPRFTRQTRNGKNGQTPRIK